MPAAPFPLFAIGGAARIPFVVPRSGHRRVRHPPILR